MNNHSHREHSYAFPLPVSSQALWITVFAFLTAVGAQIEIPHSPVPFTMQTLVVLVSGAMLGPVGGFLSMSMYLVVGVAGLPVFSSMGFGIARILGPTGGYLLAFPLAAAAIGFLTSLRNHPLWTLMSMTIGLAMIFGLGTVQLYATMIHSWSEAFASGFLIFSLWDIAKLIAATVLVQAWRWRMEVR